MILDNNNQYIVYDIISEKCISIYKGGAFEFIQLTYN